MAFLLSVIIQYKLKAFGEVKLEGKTYNIEEFFFPYEFGHITITSQLKQKAYSSAKGTIGPLNFLL